MIWDYVEGKKYDMLHEQIKKIVNYNLDPNAASTEEIENAIEALPGFIAALLKQYKKAKGC